MAISGDLSVVSSPAASSSPAAHERIFHLELGPLTVVGVLPAAESGAAPDQPGFLFMQAAEGAPTPAARLRFFVEETEVAGWQEADEILKAGVWNLRRSETAHFIVGTVFVPPRPFWVARADRSLTDFRIAHLAGDAGIPRSAVVEPALLVLSRLALMHHLVGSGAGMLVHSAAAAIEERMYLFLGRSGAGKSTLSRQLLRQPGVQLVNDDRMLVTRDAAAAGGWTAWGTPWPGELQIALNRHAPLAALLFLEQSDRSVAEPLPPRAALDRLLPLVSIPWYDAELLPRALDLCERLVAETPAYVLHFRPDESAAAAVLALAVR